MFYTEDSNGNWDIRIKLIRNESIGNKTWNSSNETEWNGSTMQVYLNNEYSINNDSYGLVENLKYYLGGTNQVSLNGESYYIKERGSSVYNNNSLFWIGKIGLMYPSDYIYVYALGVNDVCYSDAFNCRQNQSLSWLYGGAYSNYWTITPNSTRANNVYYVSNGGMINGDYYTASTALCTRAVLYLKPNVKIKSGDGSIDNPYEFEL